MTPLEEQAYAARAALRNFLIPRLSPESITEAMTLAGEYARTRESIVVQEMREHPSYRDYLQMT